MSTPRLVRAERPPANLLLRGARLLDPRAGIDTVTDLLIRDGMIAAIGDALDAPIGCAVIDASDLHAFPAFVDPHVHLRTPGQEYKEDIASGTRAAAAGGYCAVLAMANTDPVVDSPAILGSLFRLGAAEAEIPVGFLASVTRGLGGAELTEMAALAELGAAGFSDDGLPLANARVLRQALQYQRLSGRVLALHEEDPALSAGGVIHEGPVAALTGLAGIPAVSESSMIARDAQIAAYENARCHFQHLSARASVEAVAAAKAAGAPVSTEVTPHHLTLTDEALRDRVDTNFKMNPPLRSEDDRQALIDGLRSGVIDCVATDHAPHSRDEKERPFEEAPMGVTGLETAFAALYTELVAPGTLTLEILIDRMTAGGALFGLPIPGLVVGAPADICLVDLNDEWVVGAEGYVSRSANSCFAGRALRGNVLMTIAAGAVAHRAGRFAADAESGELAATATTTGEGR